MNELWFKDCQDYANVYRYITEINFNHYKFLVLMGLFESGWVIYDHTEPKNNELNYDYGYYKE
ncbi:hypothetical protein LCGC14_1751320 [marine sediment metagenome]|uniref:Uncharacterized protein n=1 Tax=marine sediment metagenome TaxID=412755 RepID=A0A0F9K383_9ZZZZ